MHVPRKMKNEISEKPETGGGKSVDQLEVSTIQLQDHPRNNLHHERLRVSVENVKDRAGERMKSYRDPDLPTLSRSTEVRKQSRRRWLILLSAFIINLITTGFPFNMSVLYVEFLLQFGKSKAVTSLVQSTTVGLFLISGIGLSATHIGVLNIISEYFEGKSKALATSFVVFGSGVGAIVFPPLLNVLISNYGWRGCLLIISGIILNLVPCVAICKPRYSIKRVNIKHTTIFREGDTRNGESKELRNRLMTLLRKKTFIINTLAFTLTMPFLNVVPLMFIDYLIFSGFTRDNAVFLYFIMSLLSTSFRIIPGFCKQVPHISTLAIPIFYSGFGSVSLFLFPYVKDYTEYVIVICAFGLALGGIVCILPMTNMRILGHEDYSIGYGICLSFIGIMNTASGPIIGFIRDVTGSYDKVFLVCGACTGFGCVLFCSGLFLNASNGVKVNNRLNIEIDIERRKSRRSFRWKAECDIVQ